ncbi:hypothetical protein D021_0897A, partial [Vibrio parahaemolyticus 10296]
MTFSYIKAWYFAPEAINCCS